MDIYILCLMKKHSKASDMFIVMAGFNHIDNIYRHLAPTYKASCVSSFGKSAVLSTIGMPTLTLHIAPDQMLRDFREARRAATTIKNDSQHD
jgi:hypothetical protein